jgi:hypothetical protein
VTSIPVENCVCFRVTVERISFRFRENHVLVTEESMTKARTTSPLTRNQKKKMSEVPSEVKLRKIVPEVPCDEAERGELLEDLQVMGCSGFLKKSWGFKDDRIVRELLDGVSNEFDNSIRG